MTLNTYEFDELKEHLIDSLDNHAHKIDFLKQEISSGRYQSQSKSIAEKLLEHSLLTNAVELA